MRLLIITQKIDDNDAVLGFMHGWIVEFSRQAQSVVAVCLGKGEAHLPDNVGVFSLGKEHGASRVARIFNFYKIIWRTRREYDAVFVHMNPEYIVLGGLFWKLWGKTVTLWYAHKSTPWHLRAAHFLTDIVFTSTTSGFRLPSSKVKVVGQGIDTSRFKIQDSRFRSNGEEFRIVSVGRISPSKDYETLIEAMDVVCKDSKLKIKVDIIGPTSVDSDRKYLESLKDSVAKKDLVSVINFLGPVPNTELPDVLSDYDLFVNMGQTGSLDKAVPEAMASGLPVLTCNEAFKEVLGPFKADLMYPKGDFQALSVKIKDMIQMPENKRIELGQSLRDIVVNDHSLKNFVGKIIVTIEAFEKHE
ncbi:MAG: glycosyltransferase [Patescibacteria group bacterium]